MRSGKMMELRKRTLAFLLDELTLPHHAQHLGSEYRIQILFHNSTEGENFKELLFSKLGFHRIRVERDEGLRYYCGVVVTWNDQERDYLIKNIERYLQEDNMGPTNINRENTKFYAIVEDAEGKKTAYEITHSSLESNLEWSCSGSYVHHTLKFDREDMRECECVLTRWAKLSDEVEKLRAENEKLKTRLGECERQLRSACEYLNGYGDEHIDISTELKNLDYFSSIVNYTVNGETKRREFGKKVAEQVKRRASWNGVWREPVNAELMIEDNKILDDAVESAMNPFYISSPKVCGGRPRTVIDDAIDFTAGLTHSDTDAIYIQQRMSGSSKAMEMIKDMVDKHRLQLRLNSIYGITAASIEKINKTKGIITPIFDAYDSIKDVKFANPATIVFWNDGTKTVVKAQGDEQYVPEVGLAMCICKKVMGNTRDYYRVFKHWMKRAPKEV